MQADIETFIGRFHPLVVHLPIGFLLMAVFLALMSLIKKYRAFRFAVPFSLLFGSVSAALACITGYILSFAGEYDIDTLDNHMWAGIFTTIISFGTYLVSIKKIPVVFFRTQKALVVMLVIILAGINVTGHLGGSLTHGSDYFSVAAFMDKPIEKTKISNVNEAYVFADLVQPILKKKCGSCHNSSKKKGRLSLESYKTIAKGGKNGAVLKPGDPAGSEIIRRVLLHPKDKKFMPADGKPPLTAEEIIIVKWWIENVADDADKKMADVKAPEEIIQYATAYFGTEGEAAPEDFNNHFSRVPPVEKSVLDRFKERGYVVKYLNLKPDLLDITIPSSVKAGKIDDKIKELLQIKGNIIWLNVSENNVSDSEMEFIGQFENLERLKLAGNPITDKGIAKLTGLSNLKSINLYGTKITERCLPDLYKFSALKRAYVWKTGISEKAIPNGDGDVKIIY